MIEATQEIAQEWAHAGIVTRIKEGELCYETCDNGKTYVLEEQGKSKTRFKLIGVQE